MSSIGYEKHGRDEYKLYLASSPCNEAVFDDGAFVAGYGPNYQRPSPMSRHNDMTVRRSSSNELRLADATDSANITARTV